MTDLFVSARVGRLLEDLTDLMDDFWDACDGLNTDIQDATETYLEAGPDEIVILQLQILNFSTSVYLTQAIDIGLEGYKLYNDRDIMNGTMFVLEEGNDWISLLVFMFGANGVNLINFITYALPLFLG